MGAWICCFANDASMQHLLRRGATAVSDKTTSEPTASRPTWASFCRIYVAIFGMASLVLVHSHLAIVAAAICISTAAALFTWVEIENARR
jgi:hypothetical protein